MPNSGLSNCDIEESLPYLETMCPKRTFMLLIWKKMATEENSMLEFLENKLYFLSADTKEFIFN